MHRSTVPSILAPLLLALPAAAQISFTDEAAALGVDDASFGRGAAMADLDQDGRMDLVAFNAGMPNHYYRQLPGGGFVETSSAWGLVGDSRQHWAGLVADFDNDGDDDVYVATGGFVKAEANQLLRNDLLSTGVMTDVSATSGAAAMVSQNFGTTTQDFDNDGDLDIFLSTNDLATANVLLTNISGLRFADVSVSANVIETGMFQHCSSGDFNNDGWPDVGAGGYQGANVIYRNQGNGRFDEVAASMGAASPTYNFGVVFEDFDNDGLLDLFLPKYNGLASGMQPTELFLNDGQGHFTKLQASIGLTSQTDMGHNTGDLDGDGYPDIYIGTGSPLFKGLDLLLLVTPDPVTGLALNDVSAVSGVTAAGPTRCHGMAFGDYDGDGMVDVFGNNGGPFKDATSREPHVLLRARDNDTHWAGFELEGRLSNRSAVGAHLIATTDTGRQVHRRRTVGHGFGNTNSPVQHVAIGSDMAITKLEVRWPSGIVQTLMSPALGQVHDVLETGMLLANKPGTGGSLDLDLVGPANQTVQLFYSPFAFQLALPGLGQLELLPPLLTLGSTSLDGQGQQRLSLPIPPGPALAGVHVYLQGWFHDPITFANTHLSNVVEVTIH